MFDISLLSAAISFYALGVSAVLCFRRSKMQFRPVAIVGLVASALVCALAVGNLLGIGPVLRVEYKGESYAFANILITILSLLAVLILERARREEVMQALKHQALHDPLTNLPNRANFVRTLEFRAGGNRAR